MENESQDVGLYDILQTLALMHSELVRIRELLEKNEDVQRPIQSTLKRI